MALWHDFHKPTRLGSWLERLRGLARRGLPPGAADDALRRELAVAWLLALGMMMAIFAASFANGPPSNDLAATGHVTSAGSIARTSRPAEEEPPACSDLDYAYQRC